MLLSLVCMLNKTILNCKKAMEAGVKYFHSLSIYTRKVKQKKSCSWGSQCSGKTTTTHTGACVKKFANEDFDYLVGARLKVLHHKVTNAGFTNLVKRWMPGRLEKRQSFIFFFFSIFVSQLASGISIMYSPILWFSEQFVMFSLIKIAWVPDL